MVNKEGYRRQFEEALESNSLKYESVDNVDDDDIAYYVGLRLKDNGRKPSNLMAGIMFYDTTDNTFSFLVPRIHVFSKDNSDTKSFYERLNLVNQRLVSGGFHIAHIKNNKSVYFRWSSTMEDEEDSFFERCVPDAIAGFMKALPIWTEEFEEEDDGKEK